MRYLVAFFLLFSTTLHAGCGCDGCNCCWGQNFNFYIGGSLGASMVKTRQETIIPPERHDLGGWGFTGGGFLGFNTNFCCCFDCGVEAFIVGNTVKNRVFHHQNGTQLSAALQYDWGIRVLPGYRLNSCVELHAILGYVGGHLRVKDSGAYGIMAGKRYLNGYHVGGGVTIALNRCWLLRVDEVFSGYQKHAFKGITSSTGTSSPWTFTPQSFDSLVSLVYRF